MHRNIFSQENRDRELFVISNRLYSQKISKTKAENS